jgi:hypothetical protein
MDLEKDLKNALGRQEPPDGFAQRVLACVEQRKPSPSPFRLVPAWAQWAVAASLLVVTVGGSSWYRERRERQQAEEARQQLIVAMRVTAEKIGYVQQKVRGIGYEQN